MDFISVKKELNTNGYSVLADLYSENEIDNMLDCFEKSIPNGSAIQDTSDVFAIRQLLINIPELKNFLFNDKLLNLLNHLFESTYFLTKAIYFDKPAKSNWFVSYHQDLSIAVNKKVTLENYRNWTFKKGQYGVQPPTKILEDTVTIRVHLDDTNANNGALKVIPKSHLNGVIRNDSEHWKIDKERICEVPKGGIMLMKPLTLHASNRSSNLNRRRVIHLEFNNQNLEKSIHWLEKLDIK